MNDMQIQTPPAEEVVMETGDSEDIKTAGVAEELELTAEQTVKDHVDERTGEDEADTSLTSFASTESKALKFGTYGINGTDALEVRIGTKKTTKQAAKPVSKHAMDQ